MKRQLKFTLLALAQAVAVAALVGCGGGGGGGDSSGSSSGGSSGGGSGGSPSTGTGSATLAWNAPTQNSDGSSLTDLAGFRVYYGTTSGTYTEAVTISSPYATSYTLSNLAGDKTYYIVLKAYDTANNESAPSAEMKKAIP
jgi:hypothetical protein